MVESHQRLVAYYGDDFSGSADVMEALSLAGVPTILYVEPPTPETLARMPEAQAVGIAGVSRSMTPDEMDRELSDAFVTLCALQTPIVHYKICSTFDSSAHTGSIGRAIEIGRRVVSDNVTPVVVGAPVLGRYCAFGNLFARSGLDSPIFRLDRHPTMSRHPSTPMDESDLRILLSRMTRLRSGLVDIADIDAGQESIQQRLDQFRHEGVPIAIFDTVSESQLEAIGNAIWTLAVGARTPGFVVGSSGVEYALTSHWKKSGLIPNVTPRYFASRVRQIVCVSGSCSPVTASQIRFAIENGFEEIALDPTQLVDPSTRDTSIDAAFQAAMHAIEGGLSPLVHSCRGPDDRRLKDFMSRFASSEGLKSSAEVIGTALGAILRRIIEVSGLRRVVVTGGDTSGFVTRTLGIEALQLVAPVAPGSPLCTAVAMPDDTLCEGLEIALKGGQVGRPDYLVAVRDGSSS